MSHRGHKTERQKLLRKINQAKKQTPVDEDRLFALRVDLNYVLVRDGQRWFGSDADADAVISTTRN